MAPRTADSVGPERTKLISAAEVKKRGLLVVNGKVYDGQQYLERHPGGTVLTTYLGADATEVFSAFHKGSQRSYEELQQMYLGDLADTLDAARGAAFEKDIRQLTAQFTTAGLFKASLGYYVWKVSSTAAWAAAAVALCLFTEGFALKMVAALLLAIFWQQSGWLAHDFGHHQVFKNRFLNDCVILMTGGLWLGFSAQWWKHKHNTHHAIPNLHESGHELHDGDPDIDTLPFLAWSRHMARKALSALAEQERKAPASGAKGFSLMRFLLTNQSWVYFPLLLFARLTWAMQSLSYAFQIDAGFWGNVPASQVAEEHSKDAAGAEGQSRTAVNAVNVSAIKLRYATAERMLLVAHWVLYVALMAATMNLWTALAFFVLSQTATGFMLALAFGVGHNGMAIFDAGSQPGFAELQVRTTRDVTDTPFNAWFMGGLHLQVEHHIFPTMPRHSLAKAAPFVREACKRHGVPYHCTGLWEGTREVIAHLAEVSLEMHQHGPM